MAKYYETLSDMDPSNNNGMRLTSSPTSASVASRLYASGSQARSSRRTSFSSDPDIIGSDNEIQHEFSDITAQIALLTRKLTEMQEQLYAANEEKNRHKMENAVMQERVTMLEDQVQVNEDRWKEKLEDEKQRSKERIQQEQKSRELDVIRVEYSLKEVKSDYDSCQKQLASANEEVNKLQRKNHELLDELSEALRNVEKLDQERNEMKREYDQYRLEAQNDIENSTQMVEDLTRQTDELRSQGPRSGSIAHQMVDLEEEIEHLKEENKRLSDEKEELQSQILHDSIARGRVLLEGGLSLADEMNNMDSTELMNALKEQEQVNLKLRQYINGILNRVIERHPEILEIKDEELEHSS